MSQSGKCRNGDLRFPQFHSGAGRCVKHPRSHNDNYTRRDFDVNDLTCGALLTALAAKAAAVQRVPAVENFNFLPDMGRMTL